MVTICPSRISVLMTSAAFTAILWARSATEMVSGTVMSRMSGSAGAAWPAAEVSPSSWCFCFGPLRTLHACDDATRDVLLPRGAGAFLGFVFFRVAGLACRTMQSAFGGSLWLVSRCLASDLWRLCGRLGSFGRQAGRFRRGELRRFGLLLAALPFCLCALLVGLTGDQLRLFPGLLFPNCDLL